MQLALFDFDGTITTKDSLPLFLKYYKGIWKYYAGLIVLSPILIGYKIGLIANNTAKEKLLGFFLKGESYEKFLQKAKSFSTEKLEKIVRPVAKMEINKHLQNNSKILIVTASLECWVAPYFAGKGIEVIGTKMAVENGILTGKFYGKNCHGKEKVSRILKLIDLKDYDKINAYGDSNGDIPMLSIAHERYYAWKRM